MLDLEELLAKIPQLIARLTRFSAFSVYLLDEKRQELRIALCRRLSRGRARRRCGCRSARVSSAPRSRRGARSS